MSIAPNTAQSYTAHKIGYGRTRSLVSRAPAKFQGGRTEPRGASCPARTVDNIKISERSSEAIEAVRPLNVYDINPPPNHTPP